MEVIIMFGVGLALLYFAFTFRRTAKKLTKNGRETEGVVFDIIESNNLDNQIKYPIIRFVTTEQTWITEQYNISTLLGSFKKGQKVVVIYNPDNPREFIVKSKMNGIVALLATILALAILALGVYKSLHI
jgi:hypothetical protein